MMVEKLPEHELSKTVTCKTPYKYLNANPNPFATLSDFLLSLLPFDFNMNPSSPASPTHEEPAFDPLSAKTHNLVEDSTEAPFTECKNSGEGAEETYPNSDQEGKIALDLNYPNVDHIAGYRIVDGAIYIDSDEDDDVGTETKEQYNHTGTKYSRAKKGKAIIVEAEEEAECDSWLTLGLGPPSTHQFCGQVLGSPSS